MVLLVFIVWLVTSGLPSTAPPPHQVPRSTYEPPKEQRLLEMTKRYNRWKAEVGRLYRRPLWGCRGGGEGRGGEGRRAGLCVSGWGTVWQPAGL